MRDNGIDPITARVAQREQDDAFEGETDDPTREAIVVNRHTGNQVWEVDPLDLEINDAGHVTDSGPMDATLEALAAEGYGPEYVWVWADTRLPVICAD